MKYFLVLLLSVQSLLTIAQTYRNPPRSEVSKDSSLRKFTDTLKAIVARKDAQALVRLLNPAVKVASNGAANGVKGFKEIYAPQHAASPIWKNLEEMLTLGGVFTGKVNQEFIFPYAAHRDIKDKSCLNCGQCVTIIAPDAHVRKKADRTAPSVGVLNYDIVKVVTEPVSKVKGGNEENWVYIQSFDGKITGWVRNDLTWDICDYRLLLDKQKGQWQIKSLIAGE
ncbi:SH3 domain-containing protein [Paraflavitalea pollutisoli]|uniref:SH3 domain-containing protein n=1 Tax=Paraflavitalea pollutisoli TaxID=3034143 RepID=UPI0023EB0CC1|nr:SH3 domain-containing protein [Paraflavitalea sp. H1-2-19X]